MKQITVVGGGFSGLVTAYYLAKHDLPVRLVEKQDRLGGLIGTLDTPQGPVELAASGIRASARLEALCNDLDLPLIPSKKESRARYLYRGKPRQWPLGPVESLGFASRLAGNVAIRQFRPRPEETIHEWASRVLGSNAANFIVGAALQGIYAGDPNDLSANLIFGKRQKPEKGEMKGLVAPTKGMSQLVDALEQKLRSLGVEIETGVEIDGDLDGPVVISTSARDAVPLVRKRSTEAANKIERIEMLPLVRVTAFYPKSENSIGGFGILFPRHQGVRALGVLFNTNIFENRGEGHSESWIYGGATDRDVVDLDDEELFALVAKDREVVYGRAVDATAMYPQRWPYALPHYDVRLENLLKEGIDSPSNTFLAGNYLRGIGLPMLIERGAAVAGEVRASVK